MDSGVYVTFAIIGIVYIGTIWKWKSNAIKREKERKLKEPEKRKREKEERKRENASNRREHSLDDFGIYAYQMDGGNEETKVKDEMVRIINLLAQKIASLCTVQNKANIEGKYETSSIDSSVEREKTLWSFERGRVLEIWPELKDRMPHFSEFEPLKSYKEEHLLKKEARKN